MIWLTLPFFALFNRARGSRLFGLTTSTSIGRLVASFGMALTVALLDVKDAVILLPVAWGGLLGWMIPAWDAYWSAEIGHDPLHSRWWGLWHMALRMCLAAPALLAIAYLTGGNFWWALGAPLLALPYFIFGLLADYFTTLAVIPASEYTVGALLGFITVKAMGV